MDEGLLALESEGVVLRGAFTAALPARRSVAGARRRRDAAWRLSGATARCWPGSIATRSIVCAPKSSRSRRPTSCASCSSGSTSTRRRRLTGLDGLREAIAILDGFELPAGVWERAVLPARMDRYDPAMLDLLCLSGEIGWARLTPPGVMKMAPVTPVALFLREHAEPWQALRARPTIQSTRSSPAMRGSCWSG